jgi:hypothetical protein
VKKYNEMGAPFIHLGAMATRSGGTRNRRTKHDKVILCGAVERLDMVNIDVETICGRL